MDRKKEDEIMCISLNINGLSKDMSKEKHDTLQNFLHRMESDIVGLQEINLNWDKLKFKE